MMNGGVWLQRRIEVRLGLEDIGRQDYVYIVLYTRSRILNIICELTGSQCNERRIGDMWSCFLVRVIILAAVFWIRWSGER